jgi:hypothetical protein
LWFYDNNSTTSTSTTPRRLRLFQGLIIIFPTPDARGLRHEQSSCISLTSKKL